jgi:hypothetical protein
MPVLLRYKLKYLYEKYGKGRNVVVWGAGADAVICSNHVTALCGREIAFYISNDREVRSSLFGRPVLGKEVYDPGKHYVVVLSSKFRNEICAEIREIGGGVTDYCDYFNGNTLSFDIEFNGTFIGKHTIITFPIKYAGFLSYVGRFCSINASAICGRNHPMNMISTSILDSRRL